MPQFDENHVKLCGGIVVWDGVTQPEVVTQGQNAGKQKWTLKVVFEPHNPDIGVYEQLANKKLLESKWRGQLPPGGRMPVGTVQPGEFNDQFNGWRVISFKTTLKAPDVYDENGAPIDPMSFSHVIYTGQKVDVLAHCYEYDAAGNKGISGGLDAFAVITSANMPRQQFGNGINTSSAFGPGAGGALHAASPAPQYQNSVAPAPAATTSPGSAAPPPTQQHNYLPQGSAPPPAAAPTYTAPDGKAYTEAALVAAGWTAAQVHALPRAS